MLAARDQGREADGIKKWVWEQWDGGDRGAWEESASIEEGLCLGLALGEKRSWCRKAAYPLRAEDALTHQADRRAPVAAAGTRTIHFSDRHNPSVADQCAAAQRPAEGTRARETEGDDDDEPAGDGRMMGRPRVGEGGRMMKNSARRKKRRRSGKEDEKSGKDRRLTRPREQRQASRAGLDWWPRARADDA